MNKKNISPEPGKRVRSLRENLRLTRKQFEEITGIKSNTLRHLEKGSRLLSPMRARVLSNLFIDLFGMDSCRASEHFLLHGPLHGKEEDVSDS